MASKRVFALLWGLSLTGVISLSTPVFGNEDANGPDPIAESGFAGEDLSAKTNPELFEMARDLQAQLGKDPGNADLYDRISTVYATLFDRTRTQKGSQSLEWLTKGRDALEKALMIRPDNKVAHYNLGVVYKRLGQMERSREELKKAIRLCSPEQDAYLLCSSWLQIGSVYEEQGFFDDAKEAYLNAREFDYENPDIRQAIQEIDAKRKEGSRGGSPSSLGVSPMGGGLGAVDHQTAAAMGQDPTAQDQGGMAQALPALGQMLMQKFGGGGDSSGASE